MYKKIVILFIFCGLCGGVFAYQPTAQDDIIVAKVQTLVQQNIIEDLDSKQALVDWYYLFDSIQGLPHSSKVSYIIDTMLAWLRKSIDTKKQADVNHDLSTKIVSKFFENIATKDEGLNDRCFDYIQLVDDWAWALDVPTALIIGTWQMETSCNFKTYQHGIFQIMSADYGEGVMTKWGLIHQIQDFVHFSKNKWDWYNRINGDEGLSVSMSYGDRSFDDVIKHGALYNGLSGATVRGNIQPAQQYYVYGNLTTDYADTPKDGLMVDMVKFLVGASIDK